LKLPPAAEGKYSFFLRSISTQRPDEDFTDGPVIGFSVAKPVATPPPPTPWKWIILAAAVLVLIVGVVLYFVLRPKGVPNVIGKPVAEATQILEKKDLTVRRRRSQSSEKAPGTVIGEDPPAGSPIPEDKQVDLVVAGPAAVLVPNVIGMSVGRAVNALKAAGLGVGTTPPASSTVLNTNPRPGVSVAPGEKVDLFAQ
jgi:beta-lactam-binding protein with PASTA domain